MNKPAVTSVAIIGGGPVGLASSILLSLRGIPNVLFERHPGTAIHPKAVGINQGTNEIFRIMGIEPEVYAACAPFEVSSRLAWYTNLGPNGREIHSRDGFGRGQYAAEYDKQSPSQLRILPQIRLEPILQRRAIGLNPDGIRFGTEVMSLEENHDCVSLKVRSVSTNEEELVSARFIICADGGRSFTEKLGVKWIGQRDLFNMVTAHFSAPLLSRHPNPENFITWFIDPKNEGSGTSGAIYQLGPWPASSETREEWCFLCSLSSTDPSAFDEESMKERIKNALGIQDIPVEVLSLSHWNVNAINASRYRVGRVFFAGDAAHRIPPWGALGMNTGIQDVQNLVWKLELALSDEDKYDSLLDTYDIERRPIGERVASTGLENLLLHRRAMDKALGITVENLQQENEKELEIFFDETHPEYRARRDAVQKASDILDSEFHSPGSEIGWFYPSLDINNEGGRFHGGQIREDGSFHLTMYCPSTIPGHRLPHSWVEKQGKRLSIRDLIPLNKMLLVANSPRWEVLNGSLVQVEVIGSDGWEDIDQEWEKQCGVGNRGAVLVRPDGIVAWRSEKDMGVLQDWQAVLDRVLYVDH